MIEASILCTLGHHSPLIYFSASYAYLAESHEGVLASADSLFTSTTHILIIKTP